jgi:hypothetical protein
MANRYYESDVTKMIRELLQEKPQIVEEQKKGRSLWWDKARSRCTTPCKRIGNPAAALRLSNQILSVPC